jgi:hypothetical protein
MAFNTCKKRRSYQQPPDADGLEAQGTHTGSVRDGI